MTIQTASIVLLALFGVHFLPGSAYKTRPKIDWESPHVYVSLAYILGTLTLLIYLLF